MDERISVKHRSGGRVLTKQSEAGACDINAMVSRWKRSGVVTVTGQRPSYGDFSNVDDYYSGMNRIKAAQAEFLRLPSAVRKHCQNDVGKFLEMVMTRRGHDELVELGLAPCLVPEVEIDEPVVPVDDPPAPEVPAEGS